MAYSLNSLLEDANKKHGLRKLSPGGQGHDLFEVWATLDRYVSACLEEKRGVKLPNFCNIGWQTTKLRDRSVHRPYFQIAESFCRNHGVEIFKQGPLVDPKDLCPMEELNFSKAAIKYSQALTKDHVFSGLKLIIHQLGEVVSQGRPVVAELSFGKFIAREKGIRFVFSSGLYAAHGLEVPVNAAESEYKPPSATFGAAPSEESLRSLNLQGGSVEGSAVGSLVSARSNARGRRDSKARQPSELGRGLGAARGGSATTGDGADIFSLGTRRGDACFPSIDEEVLCDPMEASPAKREVFTPRSQVGSQASQSHTEQNAYDEALHRHITQLEVRASEAMRDQSVLDSESHKANTKELAKRDECHDKNKVHCEALRLQIEAKQRRKQESRRTEKNADDNISVVSGNGMGAWQALASVSMGEQSVAPPAAPAEPLRERQGPPPDVLLRQQNEMRRDLDAQVEAKNARKDAVKQWERRFEKQLVDATHEEISLQKDVETAMRAREKETLTAAWQQENHVREIRKQIECMELGKRIPGVPVKKPPGLRLGLAGTPAPGAGTRSQLSARGSGPLSARGASFNAVSSLMLQPALQCA